MKNFRLFFAFTLICFALVPGLQAVLPPPDGGYPGFNTAEGQEALLSLTGGGHNTAIGCGSLESDTIGSYNTANGAGSLARNTLGGNNTASGAWALQANTYGSNNTATGYIAMLLNTTGGGNTADGCWALVKTTTGGNNTAIGSGALLSNTTGYDSTAVGGDALSKAHGAAHANTALGFEAGAGVNTASSVICIGAGVLGADVSHTTWIGNVYGGTILSGTIAPVMVSDQGQLGVVASSERFKRDIATMDKSSEAILSLRPVTFHYRTDTKNTPQFGLVAEEVAKVNSALVLRDKEGKPYTVRYEAVNAMLLNEFLKEHRTVQEQQKEIDSLKAELKEQKTLIQKVSAQLEVSKAAPRTVVNNE